MEISPDLSFEFEPDTPEFKPINGGQEVVTNNIMTHQIREVHIDTSKEMWHGRYIFVASGINSGGESSKEGQYQVFTDEHILGVVKVNSDFLGSVFGFIASPIGLLILLLIPAFYLIITSAVDIFRAFDESDSNGGGSSGSSAGKSYKDMSQEEKDILKQELLEEMMKGKKK